MVFLAEGGIPVNEKYSRRFRRVVIAAVGIAGVVRAVKSRKETGDSAAAHEHNPNGEHHEHTE